MTQETKTVAIPIAETQAATAFWIGAFCTTGASVPPQVGGTVPAGVSDSQSNPALVFGYSDKYQIFAPVSA